jgi:hypothetical protein
MGATADGRKELITVVEGYRETEQSWWPAPQNLIHVL